MKGGFYLEIKDLPQLEEATESDHVVSSISQKTRLISFKNIFEKISFSSLVTTAKNIIGSINELKGRCDTLDTSVSELNTDKQNDLGLSGVAIEKTPAFRVDTANSNVAFTVTAKNNIKAIMGVTMAAYSSNNYTSNISYSFSGKDITFVVCASVAQNYEITFTYLY